MCCNSLQMTRCLTHSCCQVSLHGLDYSEFCSIDDLSKFLQLKFKKRKLCPLCTAGQTKLATVGLFIYYSVYWDTCQVTPCSLKVVSNPNIRHLPQKEWISLHGRRHLGLRKIVNNSALTTTPLFPPSLAC